MANKKAGAAITHRAKPKRKRPGVHSKKNKPDKKYRGQGSRR